MKLRTALLACALAAAFAPERAAAQELDAVINRVTNAWARGDVGTIVSLASRSGISLDVDGRAVGPLPPRQAGAVLRRVFDGLETADARPGRTRSAGGSPQRAFSQIAWTTRVRGTSIGEQTTVFIAWVREDGGWRINQIRLVK
jgi:hypothetical protein